MERYRDFAPLDVAPATWADALEAFLSVAAPQFTLRIKASDPTVLEVPASANTGAAAIAIQGSPRWNEVPVERVMPTGGSARSMDVWVTSTANVFAAGSPGEVDNTVYAFALSIQETGVVPSGAIKRKVGTAWWDGSKFASVTPTVGVPPQLPPLSPELKLKVIRGRVSSLGLVLDGSGFTVAKTGTGTYTITFTVPFVSDWPSVAANAYNSGSAIVTVSSLSGSTADIAVFGSASGGALDANFTFIAIGPA